MLIIFFLSIIHFSIRTSSMTALVFCPYLLVAYSSIFCCFCSSMSSLMAQITLAANLVL